MEITEEEIIEDMICNGCMSTSNLQSCIKTTDGNPEKLIKYVPGIRYVQNQALNYMFSNGLTSGSLNGDKGLDNFLYTINSSGTTNKHVLRDAFGETMLLGESGIRWYNGNIYHVKRGYYAILTELVDGIVTIVGYYVKKDGSKISDDMDFKNVKKMLENDNKIMTVERLKEHFDNQGLIFLDKTEFVHVRNRTDLLHGKSPLDEDQLRMHLLIKVYERLNYDVEYDGPGRIIIRPKNGFAESEDGNEVSTSSLINKSFTNNKELLAEAERVAKQIKYSKSDSVIVLSNAFDSHIEQLGRVTKATEFMDWLKNEGVLIAQAIGMNPSLLEVGAQSGNVSMEKIIDNGMVNTIIPLRERYAIQVSEFIVTHLNDENISKVYFDKYEMSQTESDNVTRKLVATTIQQLGLAVGNMKNAEAKSEAIDEVQDVIIDLARQMKNSLRDENNQLVALSIKERTKQEKMTKDLLVLNKKVGE